jgi:hypothetical protein
MVAFFTLLLGPVWGMAVIVIVECCAGFYMGLVFAPNHKGMPQVDGKVDFLRRQVPTARNVRPHPLTDIWYAERGVSYSETSILQSYREVLHFLHEVGAPLRDGIGAGEVASTRPRPVELLGPPSTPAATDGAPDVRPLPSRTGYQGP